MISIDRVHAVRKVFHGAIARLRKRAKEVPRLLQPMNENKWLCFGDPEPMLGYVVGGLARSVSRRIGLAPPISERKLRLFACACCRRFRWYREKVDAVEEYADGLVDRATIDAINQRVTEEYNKLDTWVRWETSDLDLLAATGAVRALTRTPVRVFEVARLSADALAHGGMDRMAEYPPRTEELLSNILRQLEAERKVQADLLRDIFGNPFRSVLLDQSWLAWNNAEVQVLAGSIYEDRAFDRLPELASRLQDAGCTNTDVIEHCQNTQRHVRGCWVLDLLLAR